MEVSRSKRVIILFSSIIIISLITFSSRFISQISVIGIRLTVNVLANILMGLVALMAMKFTNMETEYGFKNLKSYGIAIIMASALALVISFIPAWCGISLVGEHSDFVVWRFIFNLFYYILIIGPVEELIFRVYIQDTVGALVNKNQWISVIIAAALFGIWHIINGSVLQVIFTFFIGLVFGLCKYFIRNCKFVGVALGHGLYDFLGYIVRLFVV